MLTLFIATLFGGQLVRLQGLDAGGAAELARAQRTATVAIPALRGTITSADGVVLAESQERIKIVADPQGVCAYQTGKSICSPETSEAALAKAAAALGPVIGTDAVTVNAWLHENTRYKILVKQATPQVWREVEALEIPGVYRDLRPGEPDEAVSVPKRVYPTGPSAASLVGFVNSNGTAGGGVEAMLDEQLKGVAGEQVYERGAGGEIIPTTGQTRREGVHGQDVTLTIDSGLQWYAQNALAAKVQESEALSGSLVAMDVKTGDLLAVASYPSFDPNQEGQAESALVNKAFGEVYEPGSTAKVMTVAAALQEGKVTQSTPVIIPPQLPRADRVLNDSDPHGTLHYTVAGVLAHSSNMGTILISETLTPKQLETYYRKFGMGQPSSIGFPGESGGILAPSEEWSGSQRATVTYGQGMAMTAVQGAEVFQTIANGGVRVEPRLVKSVTGPDGTVETPIAEGERVIDQEVATKLREMMEVVVSKQGTASRAQIDGYRVAGKTGTADRFDETAGGYSGMTGSFIGFAPADDPKIVMAVVLQRPIKGYYGGLVAAPVFHDVMTYALQAFAIPPTGTTGPELALTVDPAAAEADPTTLRDRGTPGG